MHNWFISLSAGLALLVSSVFGGVTMDSTEYANSDDSSFAVSHVPADTVYSVGPNGIPYLFVGYNYSCCATFSREMHQKGDTLVFTIKDLMTGHCRSICYYYTKFYLSGLASKRYPVRVNLEFEPHDRNRIWNYILAADSLSAGSAALDIKLTFCHFGNDFYSYTVPRARITDYWQEFSVPRDSFDFLGADIPGRDTAWAAIDLTTREALTDTQHILIDDFTYVIDDTACIFTLDNFNDPACTETWKFINGYDNGSSIKWYQSGDTPTPGSGKSMCLECANSLGGLYYCAVGRNIWADHRALVTTPEKVTYSFWLKKGTGGTGITRPHTAGTDFHYVIKSTGNNVHIKPLGQHDQYTISVYTLDGRALHFWRLRERQEAVWDIRDMESGVYTIVMETIDGTFVAKYLLYTE